MNRHGHNQVDTEMIRQDGHEKLLIFGHVRIINTAIPKQRQRGLDRAESKSSTVIIKKKKKF